MPQVLEWFQCKKCGRRRRWTADIAGKTVTCACGMEIVCPVGAGLDESSLRSSTGVTGVLSDTLVEDVDAASSSVAASHDTLRRIGVTEVEIKRKLMTPQERVATKQFFVWSGMALLGFAMVVHVGFLAQYWPKFWWYTAAAVLIAPLSFWKFHKARRRWQKGRPFMESLSHSLGADGE